MNTVADTVGCDGTFGTTTGSVGTRVTNDDDTSLAAITHCLFVRSSLA